MSAIHDNPAGCELPEALRHYYLDAMGIQAWELLQAEALPLVGPAGNLSIRPATEHSDSAQQWLTLEQAVSGCVLCELHKTRTQTVFGVGNKNAELLVIGEAPGRDRTCRENRLWVARASC